MSISAQIRPPAAPSAREMRRRAGAVGSMTAPVLAPEPGLFAVEPLPPEDEGTLTLSDPLNVDLVVYRGDTGIFRLTVANEDGSPHSVLDATWDADIRANPDSSEVITTMLVSPVPGDAASVDITLTAAMSALIDSDAVYDVEMTQGGIVTTLVAGRVVLTKDVSRP